MPVEFAAPVSPSQKNASSDEESLAEVYTEGVLEVLTPSRQPKLAAPGESPGECEQVYLGPELGLRNIMEYHDADGSCSISMAELQALCSGDMFATCLSFLESSMIESQPVTPDEGDDNPPPPPAPPPDSPAPAPAAEVATGRCTELQLAVLRKCTADCAGCDRADSKAILAECIIDTDDGDTRRASEQMTLSCPPEPQQPNTAVSSSAQPQAESAAPQPPEPAERSWLSHPAERWLAIAAMALGLLLLGILACRRRNRRRRGLSMMSPKDYVQSWSGAWPKDTSDFGAGTFSTEQVYDTEDFDLERPESSGSRGKPKGGKQTVTSVNPIARPASETCTV